MACGRCSECKGTNTCVEPSGPEDAEHYLIGEAPGPTEDRTGIPFDGKAGMELNRHYLPLSGLFRDRVRVNNAIRCLPPGPKGKLDSKKQKDLDLLRSCSEHHLYPELERLQPKLLIPMGAFACRTLDPTIDLDLHHGMPVRTPFGNAFPMFHPAGGIHEPKKMLIIRTDWARLRKYLTNRLYLPHDKFETSYDYRWLERPDDVRDVLEGQHYSDLATDTETYRGGRPYCLTFCADAGTGYMIKADQYDLLAVFQEYLNKWRGRFLFHNYPFDGPIVNQMGLNYNFDQVIDTMEEVFHLANMPQGLKALAYRELGMQMQDFTDLVTPHSKKLALEYYQGIRAYDWPKPDEKMVRQDDGTWKIYKPQGMNTKIKRFWTDYTKNPDSKDVFEMWNNWEDDHETLEERLGKFPGRCISHVPFDEIVFYACRDADATWRLWKRLKKIIPRVRDTVQENWADVA